MVKSKLLGLIYLQIVFSLFLQLVFMSFFIVSAEQVVKFWNSFCKCKKNQTITSFKLSCAHPSLKSLNRSSLLSEL